METGKSSRKSRQLAIGLLVVMIGGSVAVSVFLIYKWEYVIRLEQHGYLGLFLISLLAGSPIPIPTPSMILTFTLGSLLNPVMVGIISGLGNAIGMALIYFTGRGGLLFFKHIDVSATAGQTFSLPIGRFLRKIKLTQLLDFAERRVVVALFLLSIYPNPVLTPMVLGMGATRSRFTKFFVACWAGKTVQAMILSYMGYFGLRSLLRFLGIFNAP